MKKLFCLLLTLLLALTPFIPAFAGDRENSIEVGQSRAQAEDMSEQLEEVSKESDARWSADKTSGQAAESVNEAPKKGD